MIKFLSSWIEQITIALVIVSILEMILPKGNIKKYVKIVLSIFVVFCIISPFINTSELYSLASNEINTYIEDKDINKNNNYIDQSSMDTRLQKLYIEELENNIKSKVEELGFNVKKCKVDAELNTNKSNAGINKISIIISKNKKNTNNNIKNIEEVEKVEISNKEKNEENTNKEIVDLKKEISSIYEMDEKLIEIIQK